MHTIGHMPYSAHGHVTGVLAALAKPSGIAHVVTGRWGVVQWVLVGRRNTDMGLSYQHRTVYGFGHNIF